MRTSNQRQSQHFFHRIEFDEKAVEKSSFIYRIQFKIFENPEGRYARSGEAHDVAIQNCERDSIGNSIFFKTFRGEICRDERVA